MIFCLDYWHLNIRIDTKINLIIIKFSLTKIKTQADLRSLNLNSFINSIQYLSRIYVLYPKKF